MLELNIIDFEKFAHLDYHDPLLSSIILINLTFMNLYKI